MRKSNRIQQLKATIKILKIKHELQNHLQYYYTSKTSIQDSARCHLIPIHYIDAALESSQGQWRPIFFSIIIYCFDILASKSD